MTFGTVVIGTSLLVLAARKPVGRLVAWRAELLRRVGAED